MSFEGIVHGGVVVLEQGVQLAEGTVVRVEPIAALEQIKPEKHFDIFDMGDLAVETGLPDLATNADHYLYGHPRVSDAR